MKQIINRATFLLNITGGRKYFERGENIGSIIVMLLVTLPKNTKTLEPLQEF